MKSKTAQATLPAEVDRPTTLGPRSEGPMLRRPKLVIINDDPRMIRLLRTELEGICDIPEKNTYVTCLKEAKKLVDTHRPDIVLTSSRVDSVQGAHYELLDYIKGQNPATKVVLWSNGLPGEEYREGEDRNQYDAIVNRKDEGVLKGIIKRLSG
jgi:DNA-binding NtrC family response regulator